VRVSERENAKIHRKPPPSTLHYSTSSLTPDTELYSNYKVIHDINQSINHIFFILYV